ncbi:MAG: Nramp family divalent metal transporter [Acidobacteriota bacterium]
MIKTPPRTIRGILGRLGPGLIIAGSIVGSGELIGTTKTGAQAGFWLLWLVLIGCVIKVFTQVELGRYTLTTGKTTMEGLNEIPGPRWRVNWLLWYWLIMFLVSLAQLGGIAGGVGQALAITHPLTETGRRFNHYQDTRTRYQVEAAVLRLETTRRQGHSAATLRQRRVVDALEAELKGLDSPPQSRDDLIWAGLITVVTALLLSVGRYGLIQTVSTFLVATFTFITIGSLVHLQTLDQWRVTGADFLNGLSFRLPPAAENLGASPLATALATFGIIGVGATELIQYPYWCLEKGYARWTGGWHPSPAWARRARGWMRVLRWDAWCSALVYTFATLAFYLLGAAVLGRTGLDPEGAQMIRTLAEMYVPVFGSWAPLVFLFGAIAVLYSTFFVANAGHARVCADALRVFGLSGGGTAAMRLWTRIFSGLFPLLCFLFYVWVRSPVRMVLASGVMQAVMLPMLGASGLYFRYRRSDDRLQPGRLWDLLLWLSALGLLIAGGWLALTKIVPQLEL